MKHWIYQYLIILFYNLSYAILQKYKKNITHFSLTGDKICLVKIFFTR
jgi:hypothetical protein